MNLPFVEGILTRSQVRATAAAIRAMQHPSGEIPWTTGQHSDIWNHVEAAMAMLVGGEVEAAERAYAWASAMQRADGSWPMKIVDGAVEDPRGEVNMSAYLAVGLWHHWLVRRELDFVREHWPSVRAGLDFVTGLQQPWGGISWTPVDDLCLLTGCSSIYHSLRAGVALAELIGEPQPGWELAGGRLGHAVRRHRDLFADKSTFSMDWYYPVLGGALTGPEADRLLAGRWDDFVVPGLGVRCVDTNPWVTGAETCEFALTLDGLGGPRNGARALALLADAQRLRDSGGGYWTGWVYEDPGYENDNPDTFWPVEHTTYTAAAVILATDALGERYGGATPGSGIYRGTSLAPRFPELALECGCPPAVEPARRRG